MKKIVALLVALMLLCGCTAALADEKVELVVFAAASMTETLTKIADLYAQVAPNVTLTFNFDSSGTLKTQIQEGAECDLFISAGQKQMNQLDITADPAVNTAGLDFVNEETRVNLLENRVTLCVPEGNPKNVESFDALDEAELAKKGVLTYGTNVKEVTTQVSESSVDCGIVYCTDAFSAGLTPVDYATKEMCGQVIYPAAVLKISKHAEEAKAFLNYLMGEEAMAVFESVGFAPVN